MADTKREPEIYVARESFATEIDGIPYVFNKGRTRVRRGHEVLKRCPDYFEPLDVDAADIEAATNEPGGKRGH